MNNIYYTKIFDIFFGGNLESVSNFSTCYHTTIGKGFRKDDGVQEGWGLGKGIWRFICR